RRLEFRRLVVRSSLRSEVELVLIDHGVDPGRHGGDQGSQVAELHRLFVGLPLVVPLGHSLQHPAARGDLALDVGEKELCQLHRLAPSTGYRRPGSRSAIRSPITYRRSLSPVIPSAARDPGLDGYGIPRRCAPRDDAQVTNYCGI